MTVVSGKPVRYQGVEDGAAFQTTLACPDEFAPRCPVTRADTDPGVAYVCQLTLP